MSEAIKEILNGLHDDIIAIWEMGQQHDEDYCDKTEIIVKTATDALLALTNLKPDNRPSVVFKKVNGVYEECFIDGEDVFKGRTNLRPLEEKEVEKVIRSQIVKEDKIENSLITIIAHSIVTHFSKPIVYPEKKELPFIQTVEEQSFNYGFAIGYNKHEDDMIKLNGGGE